MASLKDFAQRHGISDLNEALKLALSSAGTTGGLEPVVCPVGPSLPPPPPPPAPPVSVPKTDITITKVPKKPVTKKQQTAVTVPSQWEILAGKRGLRTTSGGQELRTSGELAIGLSPQQKSQSDAQFVNAFRTASSIDDLISSLEDLTNNPAYLKKEALSKQSEIEKMRDPLDVSIIELLEKKSKLGIKQIYPGSVYLKKYLFNTNSFTEQDSALLNNLIEAEIEAKK